MNPGCTERVVREPPPTSEPHTLSPTSQCFIPSASSPTLACSPDVLASPSVLCGTASPPLKRCVTLENASGQNGDAARSPETLALMAQSNPSRSHPVLGNGLLFSAASEVATTCEERGTRSRSNSSSTFISDTNRSMTVYTEEGAACQEVVSHSVPIVAPLAAGTAPSALTVGFATAVVAAPMRVVGSAEGFGAQHARSVLPSATPETFLVDQSSLVETASLGVTFREETKSNTGLACEAKCEEEETMAATALLCAPAIAPLHPSLAAICLSSVEAVAEDPEEVQLPALAELPMHRMRSVSDLLSNARDFSNLSTPHAIRIICKERVPGWDALDLEDINVDQIMSGLSNQLFKVNIREGYPDRPRFAYPNVLFRIYGKDVNSLYDSSTEVCVFKNLGLQGVAPQLIAELDGGRVEEWIEGSALLCQDMQKSSVLMGAASILAGIHQIDLSHVIDTVPCIDKFLARWRSGAMEIYNSVKEDHPSYLALQRLNLPKLVEESYRLREYLFPEGCPDTPVTRLAFCHNDIQENNIMVTHACMRLIDFEYSGYNYPAYDLASFFWEMTCDYCLPSYPFFTVDPTRYPLISKRRLFCAMYLTKLLHTQVKTSNVELIDPVLDAVERFQLATHILWAFWSVIRAPQAATATQFDMLHYAQKRVDCYWTHKAQLIADNKLPVPGHENTADGESSTVPGFYDGEGH